MAGYKSQIRVEDRWAIVAWVEALQLSESAPAEDVPDADSLPVINNILPGATNTSRLDEIVHSKAEKTGQSAADIRSQMASAVPLKRTGEPEEVARAIAFLASPSANYISGINLPVDGGRTLSL